MQQAVKDYRYIYNMDQANFYLENGQVPVEFGVGAKNDIYVKFKDSKELQNTFHEWVSRKYN
jgi:hypothetical protein